MKNQPETLLVELENRIATVIINRPDKLNALNDMVLDDLREVFRSLQEDDDVGGIVLTGAGQKAFAAGADIGELNKLNKKSGVRVSQKGQLVFGGIESTGKPVIAAVEGYALGGGCELAMACHLRVASVTARFGLPELGLGLIPGYGGTQRLTHLVGKGRALELIMDGSPIDVDKALEIGLVNRVVKEGRAVEASREWMSKILTRGPVALGKAILAVHAAFSNSATGYQEEATLFGSLCGTEDFKEGTKAFLQKRKPQFQKK